MKTEEIRFVKPPFMIVPVVALLTFLLLYFGWGANIVVSAAVGILLMVAIFICQKKTSATDPCITINDEGVTDHRLKIGTIRWEDIRSVYLFSLNRIPYGVCLNLHDTKKYTSKLDFSSRISLALNRVLGMTPITIFVGALDTEASDICKMVLMRCEYHALQTAQSNKGVS